MSEGEVDAQAIVPRKKKMVKRKPARKQVSLKPPTSPRLIPRPPNRRLTVCAPTVQVEVGEVVKKQPEQTGQVSNLLTRPGVVTRLRN